MNGDGSEIQRNVKFTTENTRQALDTMQDKTGKISKVSSLPSILLIDPSPNNQHP